MFGGPYGSILTIDPSVVIYLKLRILWIENRPEPRAISLRICSRMFIGRRQECGAVDADGRWPYYLVRGFVWT